MKIDKIIEVLSGYGSEKGLDFVSSKIGDLLERKKIKDNIAAEIEKAQSGFEKACRNEEFDFQGLIELVKGFDDKDFIIKYTIAFSEPDKLEKAKEQILHICIRDTHANTPNAQSKVKSILDNCFSIVEETLKSELSKGDLIEIGLINKSIDENTNKIIENSNQNTKSILNAINVQKASSAQPGKKEITNDNESYLNNFSNLLFLEDDYEDENVVSLADMYISPSIGENKASECIKKWYRTRIKPCMLLYGNAGVGKSSFVSKILADAYGITEKDKVEFAFDSREAMAVALRNHTDKIDNELTAKEILTTLFSCDSFDQLKDKLIILDGLDELCVLKHGFDGKKFLEKLSRLEYGYHVLVTSRESGSYFTEPRDEEGLRTGHLVWEEKQIKDWLDLYKAQKPHKGNWCIKFHEQFCSLQTDDTRREIFCVPIILYICGTSETNIEDHNSIGSIYRDAFTKILLRKHLRGQSNTDEFKEADKEANMTAWQFTKELAYQMFLLDTLDLVDDNRSEDKHAVGFRNARNRAKDILKEEYKIAEPNLELKKELAVCPFAKKNGKGGITFAHKSVYEYFTAVKLYEDYLVKFNTDYLDNNNEDTAAKEVFESFIEAFRYAPISEEIFKFLCEMHDGPFEIMIDCDERKGLDSSKIERIFVHGMKKHIYTNISVKSAIQEYLYPWDYDIDEIRYIDWSGKTISAQISTAFSNFTWFLTINGFINKHEEDISKTACASISHLLYGTLKGACFKQWNLDKMNFEGAYLSKSNLEKASLIETNFKNAFMSRAILNGANVMEASFDNANMTRAHIRDADLTGASLKNAILTYAEMSDSNFGFANFENANLEDVYSSRANYENANLYKANLNGAVLMFSHFESADLSYASLVKANLASTHFEKAILTNANLTGADFTCANLEGADLKNAILYCTNLNSADFENANLTNADLEKSDLTDAYLVGANLTNANLKDAILSKAAYCINCQNKTIFPDGFDPKEHDMLEVDINDEND